MVNHVMRVRPPVTEESIDPAGQVPGGILDMMLSSRPLATGLMIMRSTGDITGVAGDENRRKCVERRLSGGELAIRGDVEAVGHEDADAKLRKIECHNGFI